MNEEQNRVDILLSVYNGEKYLHEQLNSILNQTHTNWRIIARDDGSTDGSVSIMNEFASQYPENFLIIRQPFGNVGYKNSYAILMQHANADYIMFSDQDDYWLPDKTELMLKEMKLRHKNNAIPALLCCDLSICDENLNLLVRSYYAHIGLNSGYGSQIILLASQLHGCAFLFNKPLLDMCNKIIVAENGLKNFAVTGHDTFLSVISALGGNIYFYDNPLVKHRIHKENTIGYSAAYKKSWLLQLKIIVKYLFNNKGYRNMLYGKKISENIQIIEAYRKIISAQLPEAFNLFLRISELNYFQRKMCNRTYPFVICNTAADRIVYFFCF